MRRLLFLLGLVALVAGAAGRPHSGASAANEAGDPAVLSMLVMGDSYSAGNGAGSYYGAKGCYRSAYNYARQFERKVEASPYNQRGFVENVACSGDTTDAIFHATSGRPPQLNAVNTGYDVIFLTIGGNDIHFGDIVKFCLVAATRDGATCRPNLTRAESLIKNGTMYTSIRSVLTAIKKKAGPRTRIVLLGYPYLEGDPNYRLRSGHFGSTFIEVGKRVRALGDAGEKVQKQIVDQLNAGQATPTFVFVSVRQLFAGPPIHELFANKTNPNRWMIQPGIDASKLTFPTYYHPNPTGWTREAELLLANPRVPKHPVSTPPPLLLDVNFETGRVAIAEVPVVGERQTGVYGAVSALTERFGKPSLCDKTGLGAATSWRVQWEAVGIYLQVQSPTSVVECGGGDAARISLAQLSGKWSRFARTGALFKLDRCSMRCPRR